MPATPWLRSLLLFCAAIAVACAEADRPSASSAMAAPSGPDAVTFEGMCDASAGAPLVGTRIVVADDEDNTLHTYDVGRPGPPVDRLDLDSFLEVEQEHPEADIEGAARVGERIYWITSHGRNRNGKARPSRLRFFATDLVAGPAGVGLRPAGRPTARLLEHLAADRRLAGHDLLSAAALAPKSPGGLNIEALAPWPGGGLLIGFRSPVPSGRALLVPLLNPDAVVETAAVPSFGDPVLLDLEGLGVRDLARTEEGWLVLAGPPGEGGRMRLFLWPGGGEPARPLDVDLGELQPEALVGPVGDGGDLWVVSDDGTRRVDGRPCKDLEDQARKRFRAAVLRLPVSAPAAAAPARPDGPR